MDDDNIIDFGELTRMRNLKPYTNKTDEELIEIIRNRKPHAPRPKPLNPRKKDDYDLKFRQRIKMLQKEFAVDMNDSNDAEMLKNLVRHQIQLENINRDINTIHAKTNPTKDDFISLDRLGDVQRKALMSYNDLQGQLGISRKQRKEKQTDDVPQWIDSVLDKAKNFYDRKTVQISCPKCQIELARYWLNFPKEKNDIELSLTCWKCKEVIEYIG